MNEYILTAAVYAVAGFLQGVTGFGSALVAIPFITMYLDFPSAVAMSVLCGTMLNAQLGWSYRRFADRDRLRPLFVGALPGVLAGVVLLRLVPGHAMKTGMGVFLLAYAGYGLFWERTRLHGLASLWGYVAGFCSGAFGAAFGAGGPPTVVYTTLSGWPKDAVKATLACFFLAVCVVSALAHMASGMWNMRVMLLVAVAAPAVWAGAHAGIAVSRRIGEHSYRRMLFILLAAMGGMMLYSAGA